MKRYLCREEEEEEETTTCDDAPSEKNLIFRPQTKKQCLYSIKDNVLSISPISLCDKDAASFFAINLPDELWLVIASHSPDATTWYNLALGVPAIGRWSMEKLGGRLTSSVLFSRVMHNVGPFLKRREIHYKNEKLHRDGDLPALINHGLYIHFFKNGKRHRDGDLPARLDLMMDKEALISNFSDPHHFDITDNHPFSLPKNFDHPNEDVTHPVWLYEYYYKDGKLHRDGDKPAVDLWGHLEFYKEGNLHREGDNPARMTHTVSDRLKSIDETQFPLTKEEKETFFTSSPPCLLEYFKDGKLHREGDLPASVLRRCECNAYATCPPICRPKVVGSETNNDDMMDKIKIQYELLKTHGPRVSIIKCSHRRVKRSSGEIKINEDEGFLDLDNVDEGFLDLDNRPDRKQLDRAFDLREAYYINGLLHRQDGKPAEIYYYRDPSAYPKVFDIEETQQKKRIEYFFQHGELRTCTQELKLPAVSIYYVDGRVKHRYLYE